MGVRGDRELACVVEIEKKEEKKKKKKNSRKTTLEHSYFMTYYVQYIVQYMYMYCTVLYSVPYSTCSMNSRQPPSSRAAKTVPRRGWAGEHVVKSVI